MHTSLVYIYICLANKNKILELCHRPRPRSFSCIRQICFAHKFWLLLIIELCVLPNLSKKPSCIGSKFIQDLFVFLF